MVFQNQTEFILTIGKIAQKEAQRRGLGNAQIWTCIAQACCESNYGRSNLMANANAFFGIKATKSWIAKGGKVYNAKTKECYSGNYVTIVDGFRAYDTIDDSVKDYFDLMSTSRYRASQSALNVNDCITLIKMGGYATSPTYINTIMNFYNVNKNTIEQFRVDEKPVELPIDDYSVEYFPARPAFVGYSIMNALAEIGIHCVKGVTLPKIAKANNIEGYKGTAEQNLKMLALLKAGKLIKPKEAL